MNLYFSPTERLKRPNVTETNFFSMIIQVDYFQTHNDKKWKFSQWRGSCFDMP